MPCPADPSRRRGYGGIISPVPDENAVPDTADANEDGKYSEEELGALTKAQIAALASELGYEGVTTNLTKSAMIEAFLAAQEAGD